MSDLSSTVRDVLEYPAVGIVLTSAGAAVAGLVLTRILRALWVRVSRDTANKWDDVFVFRMGGPIAALISLQLFRLALVWVPITASQRRSVREAIGIATVLCVIWAVFRMIDLARSSLARRSWAADHPASLSLLGIGSRFVKVALLVIGLIFVLSNLGVSVASLIAGLGIGGLVLALAAQKTVENLFGAISLGVDQPMREGDFVKIYDFVGTVEKIGLRSTRIRTLDRTLVTVPNGDLANQRIESYTMRDRMRLSQIIRLKYGTTSKQMRDVLASVTHVLRAHPKLWPNALTVRFKELGATSLDIEVMAWFQTTNWDEFMAIREDILLDFLEAIERAGTAVAFPTQAITFSSEREVQGARELREPRRNPSS